MTDASLALPDTTGMDMEDAKDQLRRVLRERRRTHHRHPSRQHDAGCRALTDHAMEAVGGLAAVAAYVSVADEPCTRTLLEELASSGTRVLLPVLGPRLSRSWAWYRGTQDLAERAPGRPPEPSGGSLPGETVSQVDAVIVPALSIDRDGRRLGQGGGWYDRLLPLRHKGAQVFAMVYDDELVDRLPTQEHDEPVDAVITDKAWFLLEGSAFATGA